MRGNLRLTDQSRDPSGFCSFDQSAPTLLPRATSGAVALSRPGGQPGYAISTSMMWTLLWGRARSEYAAQSRAK